MPTAPARLYVRDSVEIAEKAEVRVVGEIRRGTVREGMQACITLGGFSVVTTVKHVEFLGNTFADEVAISLDAPDEELRDFWKTVCRQGVTIGIIEGAQNG